MTLALNFIYVLLIMRANFQHSQEFLTDMWQVQSYAQFLTSPSFKRIQDDIADDFGLNINKISEFSTRGVKITVGEQHGNWMRPSYLWRVTLLKRIQEEVKHIIDVDTEHTWIFWLINDSFTHKWWKSEHAVFELWVPGIIDRKIANNKRIAYHWYSYDAVPAPITQIDEITELLKQMHDNVAHDIVYALSKWCNNTEKVLQYFKSRAWSHKIWAYATNVIWFDKQTKFSINDLLYLRDVIENNDLHTTLWSGHQIAKNNNQRSEYRRTHNEHFFNHPIGDIDEVFNNMILAIDDIDRFAQKIASLYEETVEAIRITDIIQPSFWPKLRSVYYHQRDKKLRFSSGEEITRDEVKQYAQENKTAWPAVLPEYLFLLVYGYMLIDDGKDVWFSKKVKQVFASYLEKHKVNTIDCFPMISIKPVLHETYDDFNLPHKDSCLSLGLTKVRTATVEAIARF
jgi:hypothetical protein